MLLYLGIYICIGGILMKLCKNRTHYNGELRIENVGEIVELKGWCAKKRNLGSLVFIDIRDKYSYNTGNLKGAKNIPYYSLLSNYSIYLNKQDKYY